MSKGKLEKARANYRNKEITFKQLIEVFEKEATEQEKEALWECPVFDRTGFIMGKNKKQLDDEWDELVKEWGKDN